MPDITKIKIGNERERSYKDFPANREFKKRAEDDNPGGGGWPSDLPKPSVGGYGYTEQGEQVLFDGDVLIDQPAGDSAFYRTIEIDTLEVGETYKVIWNGDEYVCDCVEIDRDVYLGSVLFPGFPITADYPFVFAQIKGHVDVMTSTAGTYSIKVSKNGETIHKIDEKYLPASGGAMVVEVNYDGEQFVSTKTVDEVKNAMLTMPVIGIAKIMGEFKAVGIFSWLDESVAPPFDASSPVMTVTNYTVSPDDYQQVRVETLPLIVVSDGEFVINA